MMTTEDVILDLLSEDEYEVIELFASAKGRSLLNTPDPVGDFRRVITDMIDEGLIRVERVVPPEVPWRSILFTDLFLRDDRAEELWFSATKKGSDRYFSQPSQQP